MKISLAIAKSLAKHRTIRRNLYSPADPPLAPRRRERGRENIAVGVRVSRGRTPCASPPPFLLRAAPPFYRGWLYRRLPGHSHASTTNCMSDQSISPPPPIVPAQRTESARFALHVLFSIPLPQAAFLSLSLRHLSLLTGSSPPSCPSLSLSLSPCTFSARRSSSPPGHTLVSRVCFRVRYYQAWKLRPALFELFATVLIRFIVAAWPRQAAWIQLHPQLRPAPSRGLRDKPTFSRDMHLHRDQSFPGWLVS